MWIVNLDEEIKIPDKSGGVEVIRAGDLIRRKMKDIRLQLMLMARSSEPDDYGENISICVSDIADILGIPGTKHTEEELDVIFRDLW